MTNSSSWSYADNGFGPQTWHERYKVAKGTLQSPINIDMAQVEAADNVGPIQFQYTNIHNSTITNDGRNLQVTLTRNESGVTGGPLTDRYQLAVVRFHWGNDSDTGSEHSVDGQKYPMEVQLIHWNKDLYKNIGEAIIGESGLCIIGLLCQVSDEDNEGFTPIIELLSRDENKGCFSLEVKSVIDASQFIGDMTTYWTYQGSLTTPPLTENVTWIISQNIMSLSEKQINAFRNVRNSSGVPMTNHRRPVCSQNGRLVRLCSCVVKSPSMEDQKDIINNHTVCNADYDEESAVYNENGCIDPDDDDDDVEKDLCEKNGKLDINDDECVAAGYDAAEDDVHEKDFREEGGDFQAYYNECGAVGDDAADEDVQESDLCEEDGNLHTDDDKFGDAGDDADDDLHDQDENSHGTNEECDEANDDLEKDPYDENANQYNGVDEKCDATISDYAQELDQIELVNNDHC